MAARTTSKPKGYQTLRRPKMSAICKNCEINSNEGKQIELNDARVAHAKKRKREKHTPNDLPKTYAPMWVFPKLIYHRLTPYVSLCSRSWRRATTSEKVGVVMWVCDCVCARARYVALCADAEQRFSNTLERNMFNQCSWHIYWCFVNDYKRKMKREKSNNNNGSAANKAQHVGNICTRPRNPIRNNERARACVWMKGKARRKLERGKCAR